MFTLGFFTAERLIMINNLNPWLILVCAILLEVVGTILLKMSNGFSKLIPATVSLIFYALSFYLIAKAIQTIDVGVAYAIWSAVGIICIAIISFFLFDENITRMQAVSYLIIIIGIVSLNLSSGGSH